MATTYNAVNYSQPPYYGAPMAGVTMCREFSFLASVALVINDVIRLAQIPAGVFLEDFLVDFPDLDTATTMTVSLGDNTTANRWLSASTIAQAGGKVNGLVTGIAATLPAYFSTADSFNAKVIAAPTGGTSAISIRGFIRYHYGANNPAFPSATT